MPVWSDREEPAPPQRLQALESLGLPGSAAPENFDRIAHLVRATLHAPISLISVIDDEHQYFLSSQGITGPWASTRQAPLSESICEHLIASGEMLAVAAASQDPLVASTIDVRELRASAYLGVPVHHPDGQVLGTLCAIDTEPREWSDGDRTCMKEYGELVDRELRQIYERRIVSRNAWKSAAGLFEYLDDAIVVVSAGGMVIEWNRAAVELFGYHREEVLGEPIEDLVEGQGRQAAFDEIAQSLQDTGRWSGQVHIIRRDGTPVVVETSAVLLHDETGKDLGYVTINRDVQERVRVDAAMIQAQKMEALGSLAGGLAHDFNNLLSAILGSVSLLRISATEHSPDDVEGLDTIEHAARRAADITGGLPSFARGELSRLAEVDLRAVVNDALGLARYNIPAQVTVVVNATGEPVLVEGDTSQLQQAVLNIVLNACYVLDQGGTLTIDVTSEGDIGTIRIADTGPGMDEATISRLWEPFFSTKPQGLGTGLGLASCYGIVSSHRGTIDVVSAPGEGAVFTIHLPLHNPVIAQGQTPLSLAPGGVILVVDDDAIVRRATVSMLRRIGFRAEDASSGDEALERVFQDPTRWAAILLDLVMPQKTGAETFRDIWALKPDLPVIISSGYAPERFFEDDDRRRIAAILHKPFTLDRLRTTLQSVGLTPPEAA